MDLRLQPKPEIEISPANDGIVSRKEFFVKKKCEEINQYFAAAHFIRDWKPKAELLYEAVSDEAAVQYEYDFNREVQNCFVEDYAEEVFLRTPPPCFVVFGNFKRNVDKLCQQLADEYGSVLIQVDDIVNQVIKKNTDTSKIVVRILRLGVSLTLNFILALLSYMAHTPEARHRGYVLSGLPCLPLSDDLSVEQQFHYLFTWENKPTFFINVLFNDEDLFHQRTKQRVEIKGDEKEKWLIFHSLYRWEPDEDELNLDSDMLPVMEDPAPFESDIDMSPTRQWVRHPKDEESRIWYEFEQFDNIIRPMIKLICSRVDPQYFITIDSRVHNEFEVVQARLRLLQVWKAPVAMPFLPLFHQEEIFGEDDLEQETEREINDENFQILQDAEKPPQLGFLTLFKKKTISPKFRWELSHYNYICPVSLREGEVVEGKTRFAVGFMKYIYFLRDAEAAKKFIQNPRAYVLPIRPRPLCRFIILGYPFSGKTTLAKALANEFSIPLIDFSKILKNDLVRKKETYQEFCRQKAECREIIRLTAQAWQDWRMEEEKRISLIEEWILYIGSLLSRRIEQFYASRSVNEIRIKQPSSDSVETIEIDGEETIKLGESSRIHEGEENALEKRGIAFAASAENQSSPSEKLIQALKHNDFEFNKNGLEVEANLFFSTLWRSFSGAEGNTTKAQGSDELGEGDEYGEGQLESQDEGDEIGTVDWYNLLPPQSLSSFLMSRIPYTTREKRESFKIFLDAASKVYWAPSGLKSEFAKWRLPCFMDIPLCEIFLENPILLLRYIPEWLKERPLIPDPIEPMHPKVQEVSNKAFLNARVVEIKQTREEIGILLCHAIEKAEREGMRVTGEVISPGGWVVDNMTLNIDIWEKLICEKVFANHIYVLLDTEPDYRRILNLWWQHFGENLFDSKKSFSESEEMKPITNNRIQPEVNADFNNISRETSEVTNQTIGLLVAKVKQLQEADLELDSVFASLTENGKELPPYFFPTRPATGTSSRESPKMDDLIHDFQKDLDEDIISNQTLSETNICATRTTGAPKYFPAAWEIPLGGPLETIMSVVLNPPKAKSETDLEESKKKGYEDYEKGFFNFLLTFPQKLKQLKNLLTNIGRIEILKEIEMTSKTPEEVILEVRDSLMAPFIKKPRELEDFEIEEIKKSDEGKSTVEEEGEFEMELDEEETSPENDVRIFGESGSLCVVNLERDILLPGKLEHALRYYGKLYYFWNAEAKNKFLADPEKYAPYYSAIRCYPPLRIFITGPIGSGRTAIANYLSQQCSIPNVNYESLLFSNLVPHSYLENQLLTDKKLLLSDDHNAAAKRARETFIRAPFSTRQFWVDYSLYLDFIGKDTLMERLSEVQAPVTFPRLPELTYLCIDSAAREKQQSEDDEEIVNMETPIPLPPYASMNEIETMITNYLNDSTDLNDYCIEKSFKTLWTKEPYITQGFVLESFPIRSFDSKAIVDNNWVPDLVIEMILSEADVIARNIENLMECWLTKLKRETVQEKLLEETLENIHKCQVLILEDELLGKSRKSVQLDAEEKGFELKDKKVSTSQMQSFMRLKKQEYSSVYIKEEYWDGNALLPESVSQKIEEEIQEKINKQLPRLVFNPIFETYDAGKMRITENITKVYKRDMEDIGKIKTGLKEFGVPWLEVDASKSFKQIKTDLFIKMDNIRKRVTQKGEFAFTLSMETAEKLLQQGYYFLSKFGRWCPVQVYRMKNPIHMFRPFSARGKVTPIAYRNYIYFVAGENEKTLFLEDPIKYTFNEPHHPIIPLRVAVIGPPKSGKTTLCTRLGLTFDLKVISMGSALRFALETTPESTLAQSIKSYLKRGCFLPLSLKMEAVMICMNDPSCYTQGFVLDGIPFDAAVTQSLAEKGKLPFVIISLVCDSYFGKIAREKLDTKQFRLPYKNRTNLDTRYKDWNETYKRFAQWNQDTYNNLYEVNAKLNVVDIFYQAYDIIRKSFFGILYYVDNCVTSRVLPLRYLCVSQQEYELRKSTFGNNCLVCWREKKCLVGASDTSAWSGLVQYGMNFYWICSEDIEKFSKNPKIYFPPHVAKWPEVLPKRLKKDALGGNIEQKIHGNGRCPVTRKDFPSVLDWDGSWDFAAFYDGDVYLCKNEKMLRRFLQRPWRYRHPQTHFEEKQEFKTGFRSNVLRELGPPKVTSLPPIGFLEQTVANLIHEALQVLGNVRPICPNINPAVTGCIFLALYLKAHNKNNKMAILDEQCMNFLIKNYKAFRVSTTFMEATERHRELETEDSEGSEISVGNTLSTSGSNIPISKFDKMNKNLWSAKKISEDYCEMRLTVDDELQEIRSYPKAITVVKYQTQGLRPNPLPPLFNCINFIYSVTPPLRLQEEFNCNTLYQPPPVLTSSTPKILFNPQKSFSMSLYEREEPRIPSKLNLFKGKRTTSNVSLGGVKQVPQDVYRKQLFIPRFQVYDTLPSPEVPKTPKVVQEVPLAYNPLYNYTYSMLFSQFFSTSHVLRCFETVENSYLEFAHLLCNDLELTTAQTEFIYKPRRTASQKSRTSLDSYLEIFHAATTFYISSHESELSLRTSEISKRSTYSFVQNLLYDKVDLIVEEHYHPKLSCDITVLEESTSLMKKRSFVISEVLPYPPFGWDIISRPYHAYCSIYSIFTRPMLDDFAHERHFCLLDGITNQNLCMRYIQVHKEETEKKLEVELRKLEKNYFVFDFFNLPWTSFLVYPHSMVYTRDFTECAQE